MKKISLTIVALLSLAMLTACSGRQTEETVSEPSTEEVVETTESSEASTVEEVTEDTEADDDGAVVYDGSIVKNTDHPDYDPYYDERQDNRDSDSVEKSDKDYRREEGKHYFERWCIYSSANHKYIVVVWLIDGTPHLLDHASYYQTDELGLKDFVSSKNAVWDLKSVVITDTEEEYQAMLSEITPDLNVPSLIDENWNSRY